MNRPRHTHDQELTIIDRYNDGEPLAAIMADYGCSVTTIALIRGRYGVPTRARYVPVPPMPDEPGWLIAERLGTDSSRVRRLKAQDRCLVGTALRLAAAHNLDPVDVGL